MSARERGDNDGHHEHGEHPDRHEPAAAVIHVITLW